MEDHRDRFVVIAAGYRKEMNDFLRANSGLASRFPLTIDFPDYSDAELLQILAASADGMGMVVSEDFVARFAEMIPSPRPGEFRQRAVGPQPVGGLPRASGGAHRPRDRER